MLPVKKSNFLAATLKREETAKQRERERVRKTGRQNEAGKQAGKKEME